MGSGHGLLWLGNGVWTWFSVFGVAVLDWGSYLLVILGFGSSLLVMLLDFLLGCYFFQDFYEHIFLILNVNYLLCI